MQGFKQLKKNIDITEKIALLVLSVSTGINCLNELILIKIDSISSGVFSVIPILEYFSIFGISSSIISDLTFSEM